MASKQDLDRDVGLAFYKHHLVYGWKHGFGYGWLPMPIQHAIVSVWNWTTCRLLGHDWFGPWPDTPITKKTCSACCKEE